MFFSRIGARYPALALPPIWYVGRSRSPLSLLQALSDAHAEDFADRPRDVEWVSLFWLGHHRIGSLMTEMIDANIEKKLKEENLKHRPQNLFTEERPQGGRSRRRGARRHQCGVTAMTAEPAAAPRCPPPDGAARRGGPAARYRSTASRGDPCRFRRAAPT